MVKKKHQRTVAADAGCEVIQGVTEDKFCEKFVDRIDQHIVMSWPFLVFRSALHRTEKQKPLLFDLNEVWICFFEQSFQFSLKWPKKKGNE